MTASSAHTDFGLDFATNGMVKDIFATEKDSWAWFQLEFSKEMTVARLIVFARQDEFYYPFNNIGVYIGNSPASLGILSKNSVCKQFVGPPQQGEIIFIECNQPVSGKYVILQRTGAYGMVSFAEILICGF